MGGSCGAAHRRTENGSCRSSHRVGDVVQHVRHLAADGTHGGDGGDRDQRGDENVFNGGGAAFVLHQATKNGQHQYLQNMKLVISSTGLPPGLGLGGVEDKRPGTNAPIPHLPVEVRRLKYWNKRRIQHRYCINCISYGGGKADGIVATLGGVS